MPDNKYSLSPVLVIKLLFVFALSCSGLCDVCLDSVESVQCVMWSGVSVPAA